jgi:hypothetical protein
LSKQEEEALRIEREKKYEETRNRIFGTANSAPGSGEKKVWEAKEKEKGLPIRGPKGPSEGKGFASGRGRGK